MTRERPREGGKVKILPRAVLRTPRSVRVINPIEGFLRRHVPFVTQFGDAWPDINALYDRTHPDEEWFEDQPELRTQST